MAQITLRNTGYGTSNAALLSSETATVVKYYTGSSPGVGTVLYDDAGSTTPFDGASQWWTVDDNLTAYQIDSAGEILGLAQNQPPTIVNSIATETVEVNTSYDPLATGITTTDPEGGAVGVTFTPALDITTIGTYTLTFTATDNAGQTTDATQTRVVTVEAAPDTEPPVITLNGANPYTILQGQPYSEPVTPGYSATDDVDGDLTASVSVDNGVDINTPDTYEVKYNVSDSAGNAAVEQIRTVIVSALTWSVTFPSGTVNEGSTATATFTSNTLNTNLTYEISGVSAADITGPLSGGVTLTGGSFTLNIPIVADSSVGEGDETLTIKFLEDGVEKDSASITVSDTSVDGPPVANNNQQVSVAHETDTPFTFDASDNGTLTINITSGPSLGNIINQSGLSATYQPNAGVANQSDTIQYTATDDSGQSDTGQITFNIGPIPNIPPIISNGPSFANGICNQSTTYSFTVEAEDPDNNANSTSPSILAYSSNTSSTTGGTVSINGASYTYTPNVNFSGIDTFEVVVSDGEDSVSQLVTVEVLELAYVALEGSAFDGSTNTVCELPRSQTYYMSSLLVSSLDDISQDMQIYNDQELTDLATTNTQNPLISVVIDPVNDNPIILGVSPAGSITSVAPCAAPPNQSSNSQLIYASGDTQYCDGLVESVVVYYPNVDNGGLSDNATIEDLVNLATIDTSFKLFTADTDVDEYVAGLNNELNGLIPAGIYANSIDSIYAKTGATNNWQYNAQAGNYLFECPTPINYVARQVDNSTPSMLSVNNIDTAWEFCNSTKTAINIWYRANQEDVDNGLPAFTLLEIAQNNIAIYKSEEGANQEEISDLYESNIIGYGETAYLVWQNDGDGSNYQWYGFTGQGNLCLGQDATNYGECVNLEPSETINDERMFVNMPPNNSILEKNVYYAFLACEPLLDDTDYYWPVYVVDGLHEYDNDTTSHIKEFVDAIAVDESGNKSSPDNGAFRFSFDSGSTSCLQFKHKIVAENSTDAVNRLINDIEPYGIDGEYRVLEVNGVDLGFSSENTINTYNPLLIEGDLDQCEMCVDSTVTGTYDFPVLPDYVLKSNGPNFDLEKNYNLDDVSKPLLRTNPKLSTNVKLVVNSRDSLYLESIDADRTLSDVRYKKFPISPEGDYAFDVASFFKKNSTTNEIMYNTKRSDSDVAVLDSYNKQIEEDYHYGTTYNYSKLHGENLRMFAPIWIDTNVPKKFVIFRTTSPSGSIDFEDDASGKLGMINEIIKNSEIIKTFDLTSNSNIGKYIRNHVQQETFPKSPLTFSFEKGEQSFFNGIDVKKGGFTSKGEFLHKDFVLQDKPLIEANDLITDGFKRNNIACANLINLEFLFDDDNASDYGINRYFGLYVDDIDSGDGEINRITNNIVRFSTLNSYIDVNNPSSAIPSNKQMTHTPTLGYININDTYYKISNKSFYDTNLKEVLIDNTSEIISEKIGIKKTSRVVELESNENAGCDFIKLDIVENPFTNDSFAIVDSREEAYKFTFIKFVPNETITLSLVDGGKPYTLSFTTQATWEDTITNISSQVASNYLREVLVLDFENDEKSFYLTEKKANLGELDIQVSGAVGNILKVDQIQSNVNLANNTFTATFSLDPGKIDGKKFSNQGTLSEVAAAIANVINNYEENKFEAWSVGSQVYIKNDIPGYRLLQQTLLIKRGNVSNFISSDNLDVDGKLLALRKRELWTQPDNLTVLDIWVPYFLNGGNSPGKSVFVTNETVSEIQVGDYIETNYSGVYNKVIDIVEDIEKPSSEYSKIILEDRNTISNGDATVFNEQTVKIGLFSAYNIYDMNFDFYDTSNSELKELNLETRDRILYEPYENAVNSIDAITGQPTTELDASTIMNDDFGLNPDDYFTNLSPILNEEKSEDEIPTKIKSEFDRLQENYLKEFAINSRVVPNINKWVLKDTLTVRENPYYLNANEVFGVTNFSPDLTAEDRDRDNMTHEWFYLDKMPKYVKYNELNDTFSYVNFVEGFELTPELFKSTQFDYFDRFMISDGFEKTLTREDYLELYGTEGVSESDLLRLEGEINTFFKTELRKKYSIINNGNDVSFANTIFKGINVEFKKRKSDENTMDFVKDSEFNGYKFSVLLKHNTDVELNSVEYEIIQNKKFGFVLVFINLNISDFWIGDNFNRKLLYELKHKIVYDSNQQDYVYANTTFGGAFDFNSADWSSATGPYTLNGLTHVNGTVPNYETQIAVNDEGLYGDILIDLYPNTPGNTIYKMSIAEVESPTQIKVAGKPVNVNDPNDILDVEFLPNSLQLTASYEYVDGGSNMHEVLLNKLSIGNFTELLNSDSEEIKYTTVEEDGQVLQNKFVLRFSDGKEFAKFATITVEEDDDKPKSFKLSKGNIGFNLVESSDVNYYPFLVRHNGNYTVDLKPVVTFTDMYTHFKTNRIQSTIDSRELALEESLYKHSLTDIEELNLAKFYYRKYNRCGTTFNLGFIQDKNQHDSDWGMIKNHFYHKVNEVNPLGVTKLSASTEKLPLYPLIGEIAIDKKDVNVFRSSWDANYFTRSLKGDNFESLPGTIDTNEERSYMASTIMKPKDGYTLTSYTSSYVKTQKELDDILKNSTNKTETVIYEDERSIIIDFYTLDVLKRVISEDGVLNAISKYVTPENSAGDKTTLKDDALLYVENNLLGQYIIDAVQLFTKKKKGSSSELTNVENVDQLTSGGFIRDNSFRYKQHKQKPMNFRLIYNKRRGYSYDIKTMLKIKS